MSENAVLANPVYRGERCRACQTPIVFVATPKGHREPLERDTRPLLGWLDTTPATVLRVVAVIDGHPMSLSVGRADELGLISSGDAPIHVSHFATCPSRDLFRRRQR